MAYTTSILDKRITIQNRKEATTGKFGRYSQGVEWEDTCSVWASVEWAKGLRTLREGAIDAYGCVVVRMRYNCMTNMRSRIVWEGVAYQILPETFHADKHANTIQFTAQAVINESTPA